MMKRKVTSSTRLPLIRCLHELERNEMEVIDAVVILSCQTFVRSRLDLVAFSSTQIAPEHIEGQMFFLSQARFSDCV